MQPRRVTGHRTLAMSDAYDHAGAEHLSKVRKVQEKLFSISKARYPCLTILYNHLQRGLLTGRRRIGCEIIRQTITALNLPGGSASRPAIL